MLEGISGSRTLVSNNVLSFFGIGFHISSHPFLLRLSLGYSEIETSFFMLEVE
jgi:hypothetical protein